MSVNRFFRFLKAFRDHDPDDMLLYRTAGEGASLSLGDIRSIAEYIELLEKAIDDFADSYQEKIKQYNQLVDNCYDLQLEIEKAIDALKGVEVWWLTQGMKNSIGAPHAMFKVRKLLNDLGESD